MNRAEKDVKALRAYCIRATRLDRDNVTSLLLDSFYPGDSSCLASLKFLFFPKDHTYFLPLANKIPSGGGEFGRLPANIIVNILHYVSDGIHSLVGFMLISKFFHQIINLKASLLWHSISAASSKYLPITERSRQLDYKDDAQIELEEIEQVTQQTRTRNAHTLLQVIQCQLPLEFFKLLLPLYPNWKDKNERNVFHWMAICSSCANVTDVALLFLSCGVNIQALDIYKRTPLHYASLWGHSSLGQFIWDNSTGPYYPDIGGQTVRSEIYTKRDLLLGYFECEKPPLLKTQKYSLVPLISTDYSPKSAFQIFEPNYCCASNGSRSIIPLGGLMVYNTAGVIAAFDTETLTQQRGLRYSTNVYAQYELCNTARDGVFVSASTYQKTLRVWDVRVPEWTVSSVTLANEFASMDVTGNYVGFGADSGSFCLDMRNNQLYNLDNSNAKCCGLSDDKLFLASIDMSNIQIYNLKTFSVEQTIQREPVLNQYDGDVLVVRSSGNRVVASSSTWDIHWNNANDLTQTVEYEDEYPTNSTLNAAYSIGGEYLVIAAGNNGGSDHYKESFASLRNVSTGEILNVESVCFPQNGEPCSAEEVGCGAGSGVALHLGALWSITSCGALSVLPNFYPTASKQYFLEYLVL